jgi:SNF2 family DNA or RNA helicase
MGGAGLNLVEASHVVHFDPPWNPATRIQASARAQRLGQRRTVVVHDLALQGALEPRVLAVRRRKRGLAEAVVDGADGKAAGPGLTLREIRELFA